MSMNLDKLEKQIKQGKIDLKDLSDWLERRLTLDELDILRDDGFVTDKDLFFIYASSSKKGQERWLNGLHLIALNDAKRKLSNGFKFKYFKGFSMEGYFRPVPEDKRKDFLKDDKEKVFLANADTVFQCSSHEELEEVLDNNLFEKGEDDDKADITLFI
ncbi:MAG: hypothetical protein N4R51_02055 [Lactobacillus crispatus]|nr:hypothetical protein [Lactobacillus crispatus]